MPEAWRKRAEKELKKPKPWKELGCCVACYFAKGMKCSCRCGGEYHGMGPIKKPKTEEEFKTMIQLKPLSDETSEKLYQTLENSLLEHPEWKKHFERLEL